MASFWKTCGQTVLLDRSLLIGQKLTENTKLKKFKCDILSDFQTLCKPFKRNPSFAFLCKDKQYFFSKNVKPAFFVKFFSLLNHPSFLWWRDGGAHFQVKRILILDFVQNRDYSKKKKSITLWWNLIFFCSLLQVYFESKHRIFGAKIQICSFINWRFAHCLKISQNVAFQFWHFPLIFDLLKLTCLVTLYDP